MAVAAEYLAKLGADLTGLETAIASARAKLAALGADVPATGIDSFVGRARTALAGVEAPIAAISTSFASVGTAATAAFEKVSAAGATVTPVLTSISVSAEAAGAAIVSSSQLSTNALNQVAASAEIAGTAIRSNGSGASAALDAVATSSTVAGQAAAKMGSEVSAVSTGLGTMAQGAVGATSSVADLALRKAELMTQLAGVSKELRSETSVMLGAQEAAKALGGNSAQLNQVYAESQAKVADLAVKQQLLKNELGNVAGALKTATVAQQATNVVQDAAGKTTADLGQKTGILSALMSTHTTQITSQGTVWKGYDNIVQAVIRSMGGIPVIWALAITVAGVLASKLLTLGAEKKKVADITEELIKNDILLADIFGRLVGSSDVVSESLAKQAESYRALFEVDVTGALVAFNEQYKKLATSVTDSIEAQGRYNQAVAASQKYLEGLSGVQLDVARAQDVAGATADRLGTSIANETAERGKEEAATTKAVAALVAFYNAGLLTVDQLEAMARNAGIAGGAFDRLHAELLKATSAQEQLNAAAANYRPPKLDSTIQTYDQLRAAVNANAADLEKAGRTQGEILIALKPQLEALKKATIDKAAADLTSVGASLKNSAAQKLLSDELKKGGDKAAEYAGKLPALDKNIRALSSTTEAHAKAAGGAGKAVQQYAAEVLTLSKAFDVVASSLGSGAFGRLFEDLPAKARKGLDGLKQAAQAVVKELDDLLKRSTIEGALKFSFDDKALKPTIASLEALGATGVQQFKLISEASKAVEEWLTKLKLAAINLKQPIFEIPFLALYNDMGKVRAGAEDLLAKIKAAGGVIKVTFTDVAKVVSDEAARQIDAMNTSADSVEAWSNQWVKSLGKVKTELPPFQKALQDIKNQIDASFAFDEQKIRNEAAQAIEGVISEFEQGGIRLGETQDQINKRVLDGVRHVFGPQFTGLFKDIGEQTVTQWADNVNKLPGALDDAVNQMLKALGVFAAQSRIRVKGAVDGVLLILDAIPGKLHNIAQSFIDWVNRIDQILRGLHKIFQSIPDGLGGLITSIINIFKGMQKPAADAAGAIAGSLDSIQKAAKKASQEGVSSAGTIVSSWSKASDGLKVGLSAAAGAFASLTTAMTVTAATGSKTAGIVSSLFTSTLAGIQAGLAFGPIGGAIVGGVSLIAGIFGSLFGGKSALQKAQEAAELQKAKDAIKISQQQVLQAVEQTKQSWIETLDKSRALLESIQFYAKVPKVSFEAFFKDVRKLFSKAIDLAKDFASAASADLKTAAENLKPVVELVAMLPAALDGINAHLKVPDIQFDKFFTDTETLIEKLAAAMQEIPRKVKRHARQFGDAIGDAFKVVPDIVTALVGLFDIKDVPEEKLDIFETVLRKLTDRIATIADNTDKYLLKAIAFFAEKMGGAVSLMSEVVSLIKEMVDLPMPSEESFDNLFKSLETGLNKGIETALKVTSESLPLAVAIWDKAKSIFEAVSSGVATVKAVAEAKWPDQTAWDGFVAAVKTAADSILAALDEATRAYDASVLFKDKAAATDANIAAAVASLSSAVAGASTIIGAAGAGLGSSTVAPASLASSFGTASIVVPQSSIPTTSAPVVQQTVQQDVSLSVTLQSVDDLIRLREIIDSLPRIFSRDGAPPLMSAL